MPKADSLQHEIRKYPVLTPQLKDYIRFFWEIRADKMQLNHKIIPQRNINLRFNLSEAPLYSSSGKELKSLERIFFSGLQDRFIDTNLRSNGKVHMLGVCFHPGSFFTFANIPVSEFKNQVLGAHEVGLGIAPTLHDRLMNAADISERLTILESEFLLLLMRNRPMPNDFRRIFASIVGKDDLHSFNAFCENSGLGIRSMERMFNKYVGISARTFCGLNRFHNSLNQLILTDYSKLSDLAYQNGYFDQMHFIRDFKRFAGESPKVFVRNNNSMLQIGKLV